MVARAVLSRLRDAGRRFGRDTRASIITVAALILPFAIGTVALVAEYGNGLVAQASNQRVADMAAYAGALAYSKTSSTTDMLSAAQKIAVLNGLAATDVNASLEDWAEGTKAVSVTVATHRQLLLTPVLGASPDLTVRTNAAALVGGGEETASCILALSASQTGVTLSGGTAITAADCAVASNNKVEVPCGTSMVTPKATYGTNYAKCQWSSNVTTKTGAATPASQGNTADPFAANTAVAALRARMATVTALTSPSAPAAPTFANVPTTGTNIEFGWNDNATKASAITAGCTAAKSGSTWALSCPNGGTYNFGTITIGGGLNLDFAVSGSGTSTYRIANAFSVGGGQTARFGKGTYLFAKDVSNNSGTLSFDNGNLDFVTNFTASGTTTLGTGALKVGGDFTLQNSGTATIGSTSYAIGGTLKVNGSVTATFAAGNMTVTKGILTEGSANVTFGGGTYTLGATAASCNWDAGTVSLCAKSGTTTFNGSNTYSFSNGIFTNGGSTLNLSKDLAASFNIGASSLGHSLMIGGGSFTYMGSVTTTSSLFRMAGNLNGGGGGSCMTIPAAAQHDIKGNVLLDGSVWFGAGPYTIDGYMSMGAGGATNCNGASITVRGADVTFTISGKAASGKDSCAGYIFCVGGGYSSVTLSAPTSGSAQGLLIIGPAQASNITGGMLFAGGASNGKLAGVVYFPNGPVVVTGGASISGSTECLQLVGSRIDLSGGGTLASECVVAGDTGTSSGGGRVALVR